MKYGNSDCNCCSFVVRALCPPLDRSLTTQLTSDGESHPHSPPTIRGFWVWVESVHSTSHSSTHFVYAPTSIHTHSHLHPLLPTPTLTYTHSPTPTPTYTHFHPHPPPFKPTPTYTHTHLHSLTYTHTNSHLHPDLLQPTPTPTPTYTHLHPLLPTPTLTYTHSPTPTPTYTHLHPLLPTPAHTHTTSNQTHNYWPLYTAPNNWRCSHYMLMSSLNTIATRSTAPSACLSLNPAQIVEINRLTMNGQP